MHRVDIAGHFGENLTRCRKRANLSQEELGFRASLHRTQIGILERGGRLPRIDTLIKLAGALSVSPAELLEGIVWRPGTASVGGFELPTSENGDEATAQAGRGSPTRSA
ncbi:MAG TPA: helix-turn-helix transcriptional regulator [Solirubrobacterales bacterium]|jgi:transcriptional regulator with XRE-family HTH domain